jgi:ribosomal protein S27AE
MPPARTGGRLDGVPLAAGVPPQPGGHQANVVAIVSMIVMFGALASAPLVYALVLSNRAQRALRRCPVCAASAVRAAISDIDGLAADVRLECGQCGTWRRVLVPRDELQRHARRVERDRREMATHAARLRTDRERAPH